MPEVDTDAATVFVHVPETVRLGEGVSVPVPDWGRLLEGELDGSSEADGEVVASVVNTHEKPVTATSEVPPPVDATTPRRAKGLPSTWVRSPGSREVERATNTLLLQRLKLAVRDARL